MWEKDLPLLAFGLGDRPLELAVLPVQGEVPLKSLPSPWQPLDFTGLNANADPLAKPRCLGSLGRHRELKRSCSGTNPISRKNFKGNTMCFGG